MEAPLQQDSGLRLIGGPGTGKSHLLIGLGTAAAMAGYRVRYTTAAALVNELVEAADDKQLGKIVARYGRVDRLEIDELGYLELDRRGAEMFERFYNEHSPHQGLANARPLQPLPAPSRRGPVSGALRQPGPGRTACPHHY